MVVFRPFQGEVILARIANQSREGISRMFVRPRESPSRPKADGKLTTYPLAVATAFFHDIFIPFSELPDDTEL